MAGCVAHCLARSDIARTACGHGGQVYTSFSGAIFFFLLLGRVHWLETHDGRSGDDGK